MPNGITFSSPPSSSGTSALPNTQIFVGNAANVATPVPLTLNPIGGAFSLANTGALTMPNASALARGLLTAADWSTFNGKQDPITLTTIGTSGAATLIGNNLNIPNYASGAVNWSESFSAATQATSRWIPNNAAANVNAAIIPKGNGGLIAAMPDGAITGGDARGQYAVDFQLSRSSSNKVASANYSGIMSGANNAISGTYSNILGGSTNEITQSFSSLVGGNANTNVSLYSFLGGGSGNLISGGATSQVLCGGFNNTNSNNYAFLGGGQVNQVQGNAATLCGGAANRANGENSFVGGGYICYANGQRDAVVGGESNQLFAVGFGGETHRFIGGGLENAIAAGSTQYSGIVCGRSNSIGSGATYSNVKGGYQGKTSLYGQSANASGQFSAVGDAQAHELIWRTQVTGTAITELFLDGSSIAAILPSTNCLWQGTIEIAAICTSTGSGTTPVGNSQGTTYKTTIKRIGAATTLVGTIQEIGVSNNDASPVGTFTIDANGANNSLRIRFTPPATAGGTTIHRVVATFRGLQIQY